MTQVKTPSVKKIDKQFVTFFENEQKNWGTKVALGNLFWLLGAEFMSAVGVSSIKTTYKKKK